MKMETKRKGEDMLLLGMLEDKVYGRCVREHSQSQGHLREFRVGMTRLSLAKIQQPGCQRYKRTGNQSGWITGKRL